MPKTGILLINTGTPANPTEEAIRIYLEEMLSDRMLVDCPPFIWKRVLKHAILPKRPARTRPFYESFWTPEGSPFMLTSFAQRDLVERKLSEDAAQGLVVELAMRYGSPSIMSGLQALRNARCERIVAVPLYPQYVRVCAGTCLAKVRECLAELAEGGWEPKLEEVGDFWQQPAYLDALADSIRRTWDPAARTERGAEEHLVFSWHSTLMADITAGDPYREQNESTAQAVARRLGLEEGAWSISYQSRFDGRKWLQPFTGDHLAELAEAGIRDLAIICPGFVADNIETCVEVSQQLRDAFLQAAGPEARFTYIPALNESDLLAEAVCAEIRKRL